MVGITIPHVGTQDALGLDIPQAPSSVVRVSWYSKDHGT